MIIFECESCGVQCRATSTAPKLPFRWIAIADWPGTEDVTVHYCENCIVEACKNIIRTQTAEKEKEKRMKRMEKTK